MDCCFFFRWLNLRRLVRLVWWLLCTATLLALPLMIIDFHNKNYDIHYQGWFIGGIFVILSFPISLYEVAMHTEHYTKPHLQKHIVRILWMVPIYGIDAWLALRFRDARDYLDPIRECYEAFVIYSFYAYLMAYLLDSVGGDEAALNEHLMKKPPMKHFTIVSLFVEPWPMGEKFLFECKKGVFNFVIIRPVCTCIGLITDAFHVYGAGQIDPYKSWIYLVVITNFSQLWALYCLAIFYTELHEDLKPIRPLGKFIVVKAVVFVTFWQGVALAILVSTDVIQNPSFDKANLANGIQDFLICVEMLVAALAHAYAFPPRDFMDPSAPKNSFLQNVRSLLDLRDVAEATYMVVGDHASSALRLPQAAGKAVMQAPSNLLSYVLNSRSKSGQRLDKIGGVSSEEDEESRISLLASEEREARELTGLGSSGLGLGARRSLTLSPKRSEEDSGGEGHELLSVSKASSSSGGGAGGGKGLGGVGKPPRPPASDSKVR